MDRSNKRAIWGAASAMAVCCTIHLIILAGGIGATTSLLGSWIQSPYIILAGLVILTAALGWLVISRTKENNPGSCCDPPYGDVPARRHDAEAAR